MCTFRISALILRTEYLCNKFLSFFFLTGIPFPIKFFTCQKEKLSAKGCKVLFLDDLGVLCKKLFGRKIFRYGKHSSGKSDKTK